MSESSIETITYSFVHFYYQNLHENPTKLFHIYTNDANLSHSKIPENNEYQEVIHKSIEIEHFKNKSEIEQFYSNSNIKNCKVRVSSIDSQAINSGDSVLISITGELALTDESPVYRFTQTFVLVPGKAEKTYDISNDIFRLIPDDDFELNQVDDEDQLESNPTLNGSIDPKVEETQVVAEDATIEANDKTEESEKSTQEPVEETKEEPIAPTKVEEEKTKVEEPKAEEPKSEKEHVNGELKYAEDEEAKIEESAKEEILRASEVDVKPQQAEQLKPVKTAPKSWADAVFSSPSSTSPTTAAPKPKTKAKAQSAQLPTQTTQSTQQTSSKEKSSNNKQITPNTASGQRNKKVDHLYAILVRGIDDLSALEVREGLEKSFGKTIKVEPRGTYALVSFEEEKAQKEALKANRFKIKSSTVTVEEKGHNLSFRDKRQNNYNNNNSNNNNNNNNNNATNGKNKDNQKFNNQNQQKKKK